MEPNWRRVFSLSFGENEAVAIGPFGVGGIDAHGIEVELDYNFDGRQRSAGMPRLGGRDHGYNVAAYTLGNLLKFFDRFSHLKLQF
jgi:hypothetical protein